MEISNIVRKQIPAYIISTIGFIILLNKFINVDVINYASTTITNWTTMLSNIIIFVPVYGLISLNIIRIRKSPTVRNFYISGSLLAAFVITLIVGLVSGSGSGLYQAFFEKVYGAQRIALQSLVFFSIASASYRFLRIKNLESIVLFSGVVSYMLPNSPLVNYVFPWIKPFADWAVNTFSTSSENGAVICVGAASLIFAIRLFTNTEVLLKRASLE